MEKRLCEECDTPISPKRLQALPNTQLCIHCAGNREESGEFRKTTMEVHQEISGWTFEGVQQTIVKGD